MDPATLTAASLLLTLVQMGVNLFGNAQESAAAREQALDNKRLADAAAADALARGYREAGLARMAGSQNLAQQKVAAAASGVDPTVGTPAQVSAGSAALSALDAAVLENNAAREAWGFRTQGERFSQAAERERQMLPARQATTVLGGFDRLAATYARGEQERHLRGKK
jgi:hypothetical protein